MKGKAKLNLKNLLEIKEETFLRKYGIFSVGRSIIPPKPNCISGIVYCSKFDPPKQLPDWSKSLAFISSIFFFRFNPSLLPHYRNLHLKCSKKRTPLTGQNRKQGMLKEVFNKAMPKLFSCLSSDWSIRDFRKVNKPGKPA